MLSGQSLERCYVSTDRQKPTNFNINSALWIIYFDCGKRDVERDIRDVNLVNIGQFLGLPAIAIIYKL